MHDRGRPTRPAFLDGNSPAEKIVHQSESVREERCGRFGAQREDPQYSGTKFVLPAKLARVEALKWAADGLQIEGHIFFQAGRGEIRNKLISDNSTIFFHHLGRSITPSPSRILACACAYYIPHR